MCTLLFFLVYLDMVTNSLSLSLRGNQRSTCHQIDMLACKSVRTLAQVGKHFVSSIACECASVFSGQLCPVILILCVVHRSYFFFKILNMVIL